MCRRLPARPFVPSAKNNSRASSNPLQLSFSACPTSFLGGGISYLGSVRKYETLILPHERIRDVHHGGERLGLLRPNQERAFPDRGPSQYVTPFFHLGRPCVSQRLKSYSCPREAPRIRRFRTRPASTTLFFGARDEDPRCLPGDKDYILCSVSRRLAHLSFQRSRRLASLASGGGRHHSPASVVWEQRTAVILSQQELPRPYK